MAIKAFDKNPSATPVREARNGVAMAYWGALYHYARWFGRKEQQAMDDVQDFFHHLLIKKKIGRADPARGKFRTYLLTIFKRFLIDKWRKEKWERYGESLEQRLLEKGTEAGPADPSDPEYEFYRNWALTLLNLALGRLAEEEEAAGHGRVFVLVRNRLDGREKSPYAELARQSGLSEESLRVGVHRLKKRLRELVRAEVARTLTPSHPAASVNEELRCILNYLGEVA
jgi:RNA polymerase sigma-70 factor (ECF subfamily)